MADIETKRISELIAAQDIGDSDLFVIEQGGAAKKALGSVVKGAIGGSSLPPGGTPGQVLTKTASGTEWDDVSGLPDGGSNGQVLTKTSDGATWSDAGTPTQAQTDSAVADWLDEHPEATTTVQDGSITEQKLDPYLTAKVNGGGISTAVKVALLALLEKVAYIDEDGQTYLDALEDALYPPAGLVSITAVFDQGSNIIYDTDSLDSLKRYLTVTANYDNSTSATVTDYLLSGTLTEGTSTITVAYGGKTTTFNATVTNFYNIWSWDYANGENQLFMIRAKRAATAYVNGTALRPAVGQDSSANRRCFAVTNGKSGTQLIYEQGTPITIDGETAYPIPVPATASSVTVQVVPATHNLAVSVWHYDGNEQWTRAINGTWVAKTATQAITPGENNYITINCKPASGNFTTETEPSVVITFS